MICTYVAVTKEGKASGKEKECCVPGPGNYKLISPRPSVVHTQKKRRVVCEPLFKVRRISASK